MAENKFNLETFLGAYIDFQKGKTYYGEVYNEFWGYMVHFYLDNNSRMFIRDGSSSNYTEEEYFSRWSENKFSGSVKNVIDMIKAAKGTEYAEDMKETILLVLRMNSESYLKNKESIPYIKMFVNRLKQLKNKDLQYKACERLRIFTDYIDTFPMDIKKDMAVMQANNPNATLFDLSLLIKFCDTADQALKVVNDVFAKADEEIDKLMRKDVPNADELEKVLAFAHNIVHDARQRSRESNEFYKQCDALEVIANNKYNFDEIIGSGDSEYISTYDDGLAQQLVKAEQKQFEAEQETEGLKKENFNIKSKNQDLVNSLDARDMKIAELQKQLQGERSAKDKAERDRKLLQAQLKVLTELTAKVRGGLGARGVDELRAAVERANSIDL